MKHYETRIAEGASIIGKVMFVCSSRPIAYKFYQELLKLRPDWAEKKVGDDGQKLQRRKDEK